MFLRFIQQYQMATLHSVTFRYGCFPFQPTVLLFSQDSVACEGTFVAFLPPLAAILLSTPVTTRDAEGPWAVAM